MPWPPGQVTSHPSNMFSRKHPPPTGQKSACCPPPRIISGTALIDFHPTPVDYLNICYASNGTSSLEWRDSPWTGDVGQPPLKKRRPDLRCLIVPPAGYRMPPPEGMPKQACELMLCAWKQEPKSRPHFEEIYRDLQKIHRSCNSWCKHGLQLPIPVVLHLLLLIVYSHLCLWCSGPMCVLAHKAYWRTGSTRTQEEKEFWCNTLGCGCSVRGVQKTSTETNYAQQMSNERLIALETRTESCGKALDGPWSCSWADFDNVAQPCYLDVPIKTVLQVQLNRKQKIFCVMTALLQPCCYRSSAIAKEQVKCITRSIAYWVAGCLDDAFSVLFILRSFDALVHGMVE